MSKLKKNGQKGRKGQKGQKGRKGQKGPAAAFILQNAFYTMS